MASWQGSWWTKGDKSHSLAGTEGKKVRGPNLGLVVMRTELKGWKVIRTYSA